MSSTKIKKITFIVEFYDWDNRTGKDTTELIEELGKRLWKINLKGLGKIEIGDGDDGPHHENTEDFNI